MTVNLVSKDVRNVMDDLQMSVRSGNMKMKKKKEILKKEILRKEILKKEILKKEMFQFYHSQLVTVVVIYHSIYQTKNAQVKIYAKDKTCKYSQYR